MSSTESTPSTTAPKGESVGATERTLKTFKDWDDVPLREELLRGIYAYGFDTPSPIQSKAVLPFISGRDIIAQAQSGTGKTGAFCVGSIQMVDPDVLATQVIILSPTRELAKQNYDVCRALSSYMKINIKLLVGGTSVNGDKRDLRENVPHIVVGCPGRVFDMLCHKVIDQSSIKLIVLDEADEMLSRGFKEQIYDLFEFIPKDAQVGLFSATIPEEVQLVGEKILRDPVKILVKSEMLTLEGIQQYYVGMDNDQNKFETIKDLYKSISVSQGIIYCNSVRRVMDLTDALQQEEFPVICIHSGMEQSERDAALDAFKKGIKRVMVASNVIARGIDVQQVSFVINFDIPRDVNTYLHRIGRSGRWGRKGLGINFVSRRDYPMLKEIEEYYGTEIAELPMDFQKHIQSE
jgi:translation initiation factor 4A